ncbi:MAG TPA: hypothetical protein VK781_14545, partial [Solirubrobacteraceae bacterium]|nr:hypothetical protein [Solirubrobacteraceae bacterium]
MSAAGADLTISLSDGGSLDCELFLPRAAGAGSEHTGAGAGSEQTGSPTGPAQTGSAQRGSAQRGSAQGGP